MIPAAKLERLLDRFHAIESEMASGASGEPSSSCRSEHAELAPVIETARAYRQAQIQLDDAEALIADPATETEMQALAEEERAELKERSGSSWTATCRSSCCRRDAADDSSAIVEIRAGTGGDEAALFAADLLEMYQRYCALQGWKTEVMSLHRKRSGRHQGCDAGSERPRRLCQAEIRERRAPGAARAGHRSQGRIHTSAATVAVLPEAEDVDIVINDKDLRIDVYRAQGAGGQHVNKTESAVRITHLPTGIAVAQQNEKSQHKNKAQAMKLLKAKLYDIERQRVDGARAAERKSMVGSGDRSERIRTYNFPQGRVTDHRINLTLYKLARIISGDELGEIVDALVAQDQADRLAEFEAAELSDASRAPGAAQRSGGRRQSNSRPRSRRGCFGACASISRDRLLTAAPNFASTALIRSLVRAAAPRARALAYITGHKEFWSLDFEVGPGVLVPRPDTETLDRGSACGSCRTDNAPLRIADLGTGSGAILIAALKEFPNATGIGFESSARCFRLGARQCRATDAGSRARSGWRTGTWPQGPFDLVFCNPPYIPSADDRITRPRRVPI